nr:hypothetical protein [Isorropodon fossajaponicum symbiont]
MEKYKHRIHLYNQDAVKFMTNMDKTLPSNSIFCIDPPYYNKGSTLYTNFYQPKDHAELSNTVMKLKTPWILTYDNANEIRELYKTLTHYNFYLNYSAAQKRIGTELFIASPKVRITSDLGLEKIA